MLREFLCECSGDERSAAEASREAGRALALLLLLQSLQIARAHEEVLERERRAEQAELVQGKKSVSPYPPCTHDCRGLPAAVPAWRYRPRSDAPLQLQHAAPRNQPRCRRGRRTPSAAATGNWRANWGIVALDRPASLLACCPLLRSEGKSSHPGTSDRPATQHSNAMQECETQAVKTR
jgi:hypothetical protein